MRRKWIALFLLGMITLAACAPEPATPTLMATAPAAETEPTRHVPTPDANTGVVIGRLLNGNSNAPLGNLAIYLGERLPLEPGPGYLVTLTEQGSPHGMTDAAGYFAVTAPPGDYVLIVWTPFHSKVLSDPAGDTDEYDVAVTASQTLDLDVVLVTFP